MNPFWKWTLEEMFAWAKEGKLMRLLHGRLDRAIPMAGSIPEGAWPVITTILDAAGSFRDTLSRLFGASALLSSPPDIPWEAFQTFVPQVPLVDWRKGTWRVARIPCMEETRAMEVPLLCGYATEPLAECQGTRLHPKTLAAISHAASLAAQRWGGHFTCWHLADYNPLMGESLGLPVYLAFGCAAQHRDMPQALATGKLGPTGTIEPVGHVEDKMALALNRAFFIPEANASPSVAPCIGVRHVDEAWALWKGCGSGMNPARLRLLLDCLDEPDRLFPNLIEGSLPEIDFLQGEEHFHRIRAALRAGNPTFRGLRALLAEVATSEEDHHRRAARLILKLFPVAELHDVAEKDAALAWRLCMLHIRDFNHSGHPNEAARLREMARAWEKDLSFADHGEELISYSLDIVGLLHNTYRFQEDPRAFLGVDILHELRAAEDRLARGQNRNKPLGDWYGTLAQHHAFRGELPEAESLLQKAMTCFEGRSDDQRRSLSYRFFARLDAGRPEALDDLLQVLGVQELEGDLPTRLQAMDSDLSRKWALFALARYAVEVQAVPPSLHALLLDASQCLAREDRVWGIRPHGHPWQLILYNLGLLTQDRIDQRQLWQKSLSICLGDRSGPTMKVMALLPLSAMWVNGLDLPEEAETIVRQSNDIIRNCLDTNHFASILTAPNWAQTLEQVARHKQRLFPFNYR